MQPTIYRSNARAMSSATAAIDDEQYDGAGAAGTHIIVHVDIAGPSTLEFFDSDGRSLCNVLVPVPDGGAASSLSGARFPHTIVARVRILLGKRSSGDGVKSLSREGSRGTVVLDSLQYSEPQLP